MPDQLTASLEQINLIEAALLRARSQPMEVGDLLACAEEIKAMGQSRAVVELYKTWLAFHSDHPLAHAVLFNFSVALGEVQDIAGSINALRDAIRIRKDFYPPYINLGNALEKNGMAEAAIATWQKLVDALPDLTAENLTFKATALKQIGRVQEGLAHDAEAERALRESISINPHQPDAIQHWIALRQRQCKWPLFIELPGVTRSELLKAISPLSLACYADDPVFQIANAYRYNRHEIGWPETFYTSRDHPVPVKAPERLRIGYVSSDFRDHAVGFSMTEVVELHDRSKVEVIGYYCGSVRQADATQQRIRSGVDRWVDISAMDNTAAARKIYEDGVHILVDLNGYTKDARTQLFAMRPGTINVNWFGFPGTMGTPYHHYIIADETIIPKGFEIYYTEKVVRLPCYQPNDRRRIVSERKPSRAEVGLPLDAVVFCCLNGMQKLTPAILEIWMQILTNVPKSVLWLLSGATETNSRVTQLAAAHGVAPERLVFASRMANPDHLARLTLADLFLDTLPYGAHTTASDSLWMGVPVLTVAGSSFASRICASLVRAAGMGELVAENLHDYVMCARSLGKDRARLEELRKRLTENRQSCLLFDTLRVVSGLEELFAQMWDEFSGGNLPQPDLRNLDIYHEIALDLYQGAMAPWSKDQLHRAYQVALKRRNLFNPIMHDDRLWRDEDAADQLPSQSDGRSV
jgi:predicted O-linked N-acetylglucosamine transferase (SPINDLY family)